MTRHAALPLCLASLALALALLTLPARPTAQARQPDDTRQPPRADRLREQLTDLLEIEDDRRLRDAYLRLVFNSHQVLPVTWQGDRAPAGAHHFLLRPDAGDRAVWVESDDGTRRRQVMRDELLLLGEQRIDAIPLEPDEVVVVGTRRGVWMIAVGDAAAASVLPVPDLEARPEGG